MAHNAVLIYFSVLSQAPAKAATPNGGM